MKTTLTGILGAVCIALVPVIQGQGFNLHAIVIAVVVAVLGILAKDFNADSPNKQNTSTPAPGA